MTGQARALLLAARRAHLVQQTERQRDQLAQSVQPLVSAWITVERGLHVWRAVRANPWLLIAPVAVMALWRPRTVLRSVAKGLAMWQSLRAARRL